LAPYAENAQVHTKKKPPTNMKASDKRAKGPLIR